MQCNALQIKSKHKFGKYLHERFKKIRKLENLLVAPKTKLKKIRKIENKKIRKLAFALWRLNLDYSYRLQKNEVPAMIK